MKERVYLARGGRRSIATLLFLWALSACHSAPVADRPPAGAEGAAAANSRVPAPSSTEQHIELPIESPIETPIETPPPPCLPVEPAPKPKRATTLKPEPQAATPPPSGSGEIPAASGVIDAEVRPLDGSILSVLGKKVQGAKGEDLGRVVDVLADARGRVRVAVIEFGGFLGVGNRRIAVDWSLLHFSPGDQDGLLTLNVSGKQIQSAPEYKNSTHPQALMAPQSPAVAPTPSAAEGKK